MREAHSSYNFFLSFELHSARPTLCMSSTEFRFSFNYFFFVVTSLLKRENVLCVRVRTSDVHAQRFVLFLTRVHFSPRFCLSPPLTHYMCPSTMHKFFNFLFFCDFESAPKIVKRCVCTRGRFTGIFLPVSQFLYFVFIFILIAIVIEVTAHRVERDVQNLTKYLGPPRNTGDIPRYTVTRGLLYFTLTLFSFVGNTIHLPLKHCGRFDNKRSVSASQRRSHCQLHPPLFFFCCAITNVIKVTKHERLKVIL